MSLNFPENNAVSLLGVTDCTEDDQNYETDEGRDRVRMSPRSASIIRSAIVENTRFTCG